MQPLFGDKTTLGENQTSGFNMLYVFMLTDRPMITLDSGHDVCPSYSLEADNIDHAIDMFASFLTTQYHTPLAKSRKYIQDGFVNGNVQFVIPTQVYQYSLAMKQSRAAKSNQE